MGLTLEKQRKLAHVAQRYYLEDWKQSDIAEELGVSRPLISRMLREARELGVVEIVIHEPGAKSAILLERLRRTNAIQGGVLVEDGEDGDATNRLLSQGAVDLLRQIGARRLGLPDRTARGLAGGKPAAKQHGDGYLSAGGQRQHPCPQLPIQ